MDAQKLLRIYGALMWSLGKVIKTPECVRVYIGSFWESPLQCNEWSKQLLQARTHARMHTTHMHTCTHTHTHTHTYTRTCTCTCTWCTCTWCSQAEMRDLLTDLKNIPKNAAIRKVNELVKRVRLAKVSKAVRHACTCACAAAAGQGEVMGHACIHGHMTWAWCMGMHVHVCACRRTCASWAT